MLSEPTYAEAPAGKPGLRDLRDLMQYVNKGAAVGAGF